MGINTAMVGRVKEISAKLWAAEAEVVRLTEDLTAVLNSIAGSPPAKPSSTDDKKSTPIPKKLPSKNERRRKTTAEEARTAVMLVLDRSRTPLLFSQIRKLVRRSYPTVRAAVDYLVKSNLAGASTITGAHGRESVGYAVKKKNGGR